MKKVSLLTCMHATVDPEMRAEFEERQKSSSANSLQPGANPLGNFDAAAWLAGAGAKKNEESAGRERFVERGVSR
jgi:hypothetical protein